jgi:hypothetical protein
MTKLVKSVQKKSQKKCSLIKYGHPECPRAVFNKGRCIPGKDPYEWRKCGVTGNPIRFSHHGKKTEFGWDMDHKISKARNGSDYLINLIPVLLSVNRSQGASLKNKPDALIEQHEAIYIQRGIQRRIKNLDFKWSDDIKGKLFWVKATPSSIQKLATIIDFNRKFVNILWKDSNWPDMLPLDKNLFEAFK